MMQSRRTVAAVSDLPHTHQHFNSRLRITHMSACAMATKRRQTANKKYNFDRMQLPASSNENIAIFGLHLLTFLCAF